MSCRTFFIADTHFHHTNIIKMCDRPFETVEEMNEFIIKEWNKTVRKKDLVWFLGDWAFCNKEQFKEIISRLNGTIKMVKGNHDNWSDDFYRSCGIAYVSKYPVVLKNFFILSHAPVWVTTGSPYYNIFGHVHNNPVYATSSTNHYCVSVERLKNYAPIEIDAFKFYERDNNED